MNSSVVGIDLGEKESIATYLLPDGTEKDQFSFTLNADGFKAFSEKIPKDVRIAFEASGSAYCTVYLKMRQNTKRIKRYFPPLHLLFFS